MNRMFTKQEIIDLIKQYAPGFDPSAITEGDILQDAVLGLNEDGEAVKGNLFGKYVKIIEPPASTTLTDDEIDSITDGAFIEGEFMGFVNPIFFPASHKTGRPAGAFIGTTANDVVRYGVYVIESKRIKFPDAPNYINMAWNFGGAGSMDIRFGEIKMNNLSSLNGKNFPNYPTEQTDKTYVLKLVNGTLTWVEEIA